MHFYDFNIGDYAKKTSHLTNGEDLAYRRALDVYYDTEQPFDLSGGLATLSRRLRVDEKDLKNVIDEFFPDGRNKHADEKIASYYAFLERQKANGKLGGRPKHKDLKPSDNPVVSQNNPVPSQPLPTKPLTTNQDNTKPPSKKSVYSEEVNSVLEYLNEKAGRNYKPVEANSKFIIARIGDGATVDEMKLVVDAKVKEWGNDQKWSKYLRPATLFNAEKYAQYAGELNSHNKTGTFDVTEWVRTHQ